MEVEIPPWERAILGVIWPIEKHWESVPRQLPQQKIMVTMGLQKPTAVL